MKEGLCWVPSHGVVLAVPGRSVWCHGGCPGRAKVALTPSGAPLPLPVIILCVLELVIVLLLIFLRKRILIAIALIKEASRSGCARPHGRCHPSLRGLTGV